MPGGSCRPSTTTYSVIAVAISRWIRSSPVVSTPAAAGSIRPCSTTAESSARGGYDGARPRRRSKSEIFEGDPHAAEGPLADEVADLGDFLGTALTPHISEQRVQR